MLDSQAGEGQRFSECRSLPRKRDQASERRAHSHTRSTCHRISLECIELPPVDGGRSQATDIRWKCHSASSTTWKARLFRPRSSLHRLCPLPIYLQSIARDSHTHTNTDTDTGDAHRHRDVRIHIHRLTHSRVYVHTYSVYVDVYTQASPASSPRIFLAQPSDPTSSPPPKISKSSSCLL